MEKKNKKLSSRREVQVVALTSITPEVDRAMTSPHQLWRSLASKQPGNGYEVKF